MLQSQHLSSLLLSPNNVHASTTYPPVSLLSSHHLSSDYCPVIDCRIWLLPTPPTQSSTKGFVSQSLTTGFIFFTSLLNGHLWPLAVTWRLHNKRQDLYIYIFYSPDKMKGKKVYGKMTGGNSVFLIICFRGATLMSSQIYTRNGDMKHG